jgi:hypothetical protein
MLAFLPCVLISSPYHPERGRHPRACQELSLYEELEAGCFLTGHPRIQEPVGAATLAFGEERVYLFGTSAAPLGSVSYASIRAVSLERHEVVKGRFSEARLMRLGHHLLGFRSGEETNVCYLVVEWEGGENGEGQRHDGIFCFEGLASDSRARHLGDAVLHHAAAYRRLSGTRLLEPFAAQLDAFEGRRCEHCGKILRPAVPRER